MVRYGLVREAPLKARLEDRRGACPFNIVVYTVLKWEYL